MFWHHHNRSRKVMWGLFWVLLGLLILLSNHGLLGYTFSFSRDWPIILIAIGIMKLVDLLAWRNGRCCSVRLEKEGDRQSRAQILKDVEDGKMSADEAASRLRET